MSYFRQHPPHYTTPVSTISVEDCREIILLALREDAPKGDVTSEAIFSNSKEGKAYIQAQEDGCLCGLAVLPVLLQLAQEHRVGTVHLQTKDKFYDGASIRSGDRLVELSGNFTALLRLERVILNFLQYLSGIASKTAQAVKEAKDKLIILDTRKTLPGYRRLAKYAVYCGGGANHRIHLSDMAMIKE